MILSTNTSDKTNVLGLEKTVDMICDAGFDAIDFSFFQTEKYHNGTYSKDFFAEIRKRVEDRGVFFNQAHAPFPSSAKTEAKSEKIFENIVSSMKVASELGIKNIVVHPCQHLEYAEKENRERLFEYNMKFYRRLIPYCEEYGIKVALENMWQCMKNSRKIVPSTCARPTEFVRYLDELDNDCFTACLDISHAVLVCENVADFIHTLGDRLGALHVHDVDGTEDSHTLPYFGVGDWNSVTKALADIDYKGEFTFEADGFLQGKPTELWADYLKLMERTGRHLISKIDNYKNK